MKFAIETTDLKEAVRYALTGIDRKPISPVMSGMMLTAKDGELRAFGASYDTQSAVTVQATVSEEGVTILSGHVLAQVASKLKGKKPVVFEQQDDRVIITQGATEFSMRALSVDDYPNLAGEIPVIGHVDAAKFAHAVNMTAGFASDDLSLKELTAVHVWTDGDTLEFSATDRYRLAITSAEWDRAGDAAHEMLIPAGWLLSAVKSIGGETTLHSDGARFSITSGQYTTSTSLLSGSYPKIRALFTNAATDMHTVNRQELLDALEAVTVMAERNTPVRFHAEGGEIVVDAGSDTSTGKAVVATDNSVEFTAAYNPSFIMGAIRTLDTEEIILRARSDNKPTMVTPSVGATRYLVMPVKR